jgi:hypothetical protein
MKKRSKPKIVRARRAGRKHQVVTIHGKADGDRGYALSPCATCPWRKDSVGVFPAQAFRISAHTAYDASLVTFACHSTGAERPRDCAGFILKGSLHNVRARMNRADGKYQDVIDGGHKLFSSYREMAIANGVSPEDPIIKPCRS